MIAATAAVPAPAEDVFALLADLAWHWRLAGGWVRVVSLERDGGVVEVRGPFGLVRRRVTTRVVTAVPDEFVEGVAQAGGTRAHVRWTLRASGAEETEVRLEVVVEQATALDRLLLACGGARWLRGRFASTLDRLAVEAARSSPPAAERAVG
ncbi:MAG TPA: SRPBCC family protein [Solirubrobacteraceae bacterium]|nr:SRPBCC family protein [Solirubrobacteraceae bacterium]